MILITEAAATASPRITKIEDTRSTVPETRALSSTTVESERKAWTTGKPNPNDTPRSALESRENYSLRKPQ
jgi:hypothetical protein